MRRHDSIVSGNAVLLPTAIINRQNQMWYSYSGKTAMIRWIGWCALVVAMMAVREAVPRAVAQNRTTGPLALKVKTFVSPDGTFQFDYADSLARCQPEGPVPTLLNERRSCASYIPVCDEDRIACLAYPADEYRGYNFEAAAFSVIALPGVTTELKCLTNVDRNTCRPPRSEAHNSVTFGTAECYEGGLGHHLNRQIYRTFHAGACYQLSVNIAESAFANFPAGTIKEFSRADRQNVEQLLHTPVVTFRFRK